MPYLLCESSHEVGWVLWSIFILPWSRAGLCFSLYLERECVRINQWRRARSTLKNGFAWFRPNRTSWSGFFVPETIFVSIRFIWAKNQPSRPFHSKDTCPFGPYVLPFPILFYSIRDFLKSSLDVLIFLSKTASNVLILFLNSASMFLFLMKQNVNFLSNSLIEAGTYMKYCMELTYVCDMPKSVWSC